MEIELTILKQALGAIYDEDFPIYPMAIVGEYEKRTEYMEGWNQGVMKVHNIISDILDDLGIEVDDGDNCIDEPKITIY